jgi:hypothetical protein
MTQNVFMPFSKMALKIIDINSDMGGRYITNVAHQTCQVTQETYVKVHIGPSGGS